MDTSKFDAADCPESRAMIADHLKYFDIKI